MHRRVFTIIWIFSLRLGFRYFVILQLVGVRTQVHTYVSSEK